MLIYFCKLCISLICFTGSSFQKTFIQDILFQTGDLNEDILTLLVKLISLNCISSTRYSIFKKGWQMVTYVFDKQATIE